MKNKSQIKIIFKLVGFAVILPIVIFVSVTVTAGLSFKYFPLDEILFKQKVDGKPGRWFPIAALRQTNVAADNSEVDILFLEDKAKYLADYPNASFQLPVENTDSFNEQILERCRNDKFYPTDVTNGCFMQKYEILNDDGIYQFIKVTYDPNIDYVNTGWYKTKGATIIPLEHLHYFGGGMAIGLISFSFLISIAIYLIILIIMLIKFLKSRKKLEGGQVST